MIQSEMHYHDQSVIIFGRMYKIRIDIITFTQSTNIIIKPSHHSEQTVGTAVYRPNRLYHMI